MCLLESCRKAEVTKFNVPIFISGSKMVNVQPAANNENNNIRILSGLMSLAVKTRQEAFVKDGGKSLPVDEA